MLTIDSAVLPLAIVLLGLRVQSFRLMSTLQVLCLHYRCLCCGLRALILSCSLIRSWCCLLLHSVVAIVNVGVSLAMSFALMYPVAAFLFAVNQFTPTIMMALCM
jgi:hypothetical protein